jgi:uncharacterized protein (TIGR03083 family)
VFSEQRQRFVAVLQGFGPDDWAAPTRCADWSAHDVVRHLCDCNAVGNVIVAGTDDRTLDLTAGFDPRITPRGWLAESAGESPEATLRRFVATTEQEFALLRARLAQSRRFDVPLPYGPMDWTVLMLHGFWDSWLHERDVLLARGTDHPTSGDATVYAAAYGLFIAAAVASMFGDQVQEKLTLGGDGGGIFDLDCRGAVTLTVTRVTTAGPPQPWSPTPSPAAHRPPPCSATCRPARALPCRASPTSSTRLSSRAQREHLQSEGRSASDARTERTSGIPLAWQLRRQRNRC